MANKDIVIERIEIVDGSDNPLFLPTPLVLYLSPYPDLLGFYSLLRYFSRQPFANFMNQRRLAKVMNIDYVTFLKKRNKLKELGLIDFVTKTSNSVILKLYGVKVKPPYYRAIEIFNSRGIENFNTPSSQEYDDLLEFSRKMIVPITYKSEGPLFESDNIYNIYPNIINKYKLLDIPNNIINNNKLNNTLRKNDDTRIDKQKGKTFPFADYDKVLKAYMKYKGVLLQGPELAGGRKAIKMMFLANRTPDQIVDFMRWIYQNEDSEDNGVWLKGKWNLWTVQKKIAEYLAGKFGKKMKDELEIIT